MHFILPIVRLLFSTHIYVLCCHHHTYYIIYIIRITHATKKLYINFGSKYEFLNIFVFFSYVSGDQYEVFRKKLLPENLLK